MRTLFLFFAMLWSSADAVDQCGNSTSFCLSEDLLKGKAKVQHGPWDVSGGGAGDTAYGLACLDNWLVTQKQDYVNWDLIVYIFGLHDLDNSSHCEDLYSSQLGQITDLIASALQHQTWNMLYVTTTPYMPLRTKNNTAVEDMNKIAADLLSSYGIASVDLYAEVTKHCGSVYTDCDICRKHPCDFHYNDQGMTAQAAVVAAAIVQQLHI